MSKVKSLFKKLKHSLRDIFLGTLATFIILDQTPALGTKHAQSLLIFLAIFLYGCIPALRSDSKEAIGPFARFIMALMGISPSSVFLEDSKESGIDSSKPIPASSASVSSLLPSGHLLA